MSSEFYLSNNACIRRANVATPPSQNIFTTTSLSLELDRKRNISYLDRSAVANAGKFSTIRSLKRLSLWPASTSISFTLPSLFNLSQWDPRGVAFNRLGSHTNSLLTFFVFFGRGGDPDLSLSSSELLLALTPSAIARWMLDLVGSVSHITRASLEQRALNFIMTC